MQSQTGSELPLITRIFSVLAAVLLVGSVALASLLPGDLSLSQAIHAMDSQALFHLQYALGHRVWGAVAAPLMVRPVWMLPACAGIICVGGAVSALTHVSGRATRKRS